MDQISLVLIVSEESRPSIDPNIRTQAIPTSYELIKKINLLAEPDTAKIRVFLKTTFQLTSCSLTKYKLMPQTFKFPFGSDEPGSLQVMFWGFLPSIMRNTILSNMHHHQDTNKPAEISN